MEPNLSPGRTARPGPDDGIGSRRTQPQGNQGLRRPQRLRMRSIANPPGFTLVEAVLGVAVLGFFAGMVLVVLNSINEQAAVARNQTAARVLVQSEIDRLLRVVYSPPTAIPTEFAIEGQPGNRSTTVRSVTLFREGIDGPTPLTANLTTVVEPLDTAARPGLLRVTVSANYTYRGRPYGVGSATVRSPDI